MRVTINRCARHALIKRLDVDNDEEVIWMFLDLVIEDDEEEEEEKDAKTRKKAIPTQKIKKMQKKQQKLNQKIGKKSENISCMGK